MKTHDFDLQQRKGKRGSSAQTFKKGVRSEMEPS